MRATRSAVLAAGGSVLAAAIGGIGARRAPQVYVELEKPTWAPPAAAFGPVWTGLYAAMGVAAFRLSRRSARLAVRLHAAQLVLNAAWPLAFFSARDRRVSLAVITALDVLVAAETVAAAREDPVAAGLLSPYLAWCLFATALNAAVGDPSSA
ncbi:MAG TPA: TspO/MBR family protein [Acidimicrobiales bacterium]|nr:TspO/MBR family protein [Acidimicrobiales bacterium]